MIKKLTSALLALTLCASIFAGCSKSDSQGSANGSAAADGKKTTFGIEPFATPQVLRVGFFAGSALSIPFYVADKEGFFKNLNIKVEYKSFTNGPAMMEANADWDIAGAGSAGIVNGQLGHDTPMIGISDYEDNQAVFVRKDSPLAKDPSNKENWKNTTWLYPVGTTAHLTLAKTVESVGLSMNDIKSINMDVSSALNAFNGGQGDGMVVWHAFAFNAEDKGYVKLSDTAKMKITNPSGLVATRDALKNKRELITKTWAVYYKTVDWIKANQENMDKTIQYYKESDEDEGIKVDDSIAKRIMQYYKGPTFDKSIELMTKTAPDPKGLYKKRDLLQAEIDELDCLDFFIKLGKYTPADREKMFDNGLIDPSIAKEAKAMLDKVSK